MLIITVHGGHEGAMAHLPATFPHLGETPHPRTASSLSPPPPSQ